MAEGAVIGGEGNGGVIVTQIGPSRDAALGLALVLEAMACTGQSLEELIAALPSYAIDKRKITCIPEQLAAAIAALRDRYPQAYIHPVRDGSKLYLSGQAQMPVDPPPRLQHRTHRPRHRREHERRRSRSALRRGGRVVCVGKGQVGTRAERQTSLFG